MKDEYDFSRAKPVCEVPVLARHQGERRGRTPVIVRIDDESMFAELAWPATPSLDEDGRTLVKFPQFPGAATDGATREEALAEAADCLAEAVADLIAEGEALPVPAKPKRGQVLVTLPAQMAAKAALYMAFQDSGRSARAVAGELGIDEKEVRRMLDPHHATKLPRIEAALRVLGRRLVVGVESM